MSTLATVLGVALLGGASTVASATPSAPSDSTQNVLVILMDDVGVDFLSVYTPGPETALTPNIDALAAAGVTFRNVWSYPLCTPARSCLLTGLYGYHTGIGKLLSPLVVSEYELSPMLDTLPELLEFSTYVPYQTAAIGKWHLGHDQQSPNLFGFGHFAGPLWNLGDVGVVTGSPYYTYTKVVDGQVLVSTTYATTDQVDDALAWLNGASEPWFLYLPFSAAHVPYHVPPPQLHSDPGLVTCSGAHKRDCFKAMIEAMDTEIGRLLAGIPPGVMSNTTVMLLSDNGSNHNVIAPPFDPSHGKGSLYQEGVRVPLIVTSPLVTTPGAVSDALVGIVDVYATVAALAHVDLNDRALVPPGTAKDSVSFYPNIVDPSAPSQRAYLLTERFSPNGATSWIPPQVPSAPYCQTDIGFQGPGNATLALCGDFLDLGNSADLVLTGALPNASVEIRRATQLNPTTGFGGVLAFSPDDDTRSFHTDGSGGLFVPDFFSTSLADYTTTTEYFFQAVVVDRPQRIAQVTNAIHLQVVPSQLRAIRNQCYKLITSYGSPRYEELYDLCSDPLEHTNLLASGPLVPGTVEYANYAALRAELDAMVR